MHRCPVTALPQRKKSQLHQSIDDERPFYITIESYEINPNINVVFYSIEIGLKYSDNTIEKHTTLKRYSQLEKLDHLIRARLPSCTLTQFPKKKYFFNTSESFIRKRAEDLQTYLSSFTQEKGLIRLPEFRVFFGI